MSQTPPFLRTFVSLVVAVGAFLFATNGLHVYSMAKDATTHAIDASETPGGLAMILGLLAGLVALVVAAGIAGGLYAFTYRYLAITTTSLLATVVTLAIFIVMAIGIQAVPQWQSAPAEAASAQSNNIDNVVNTLFDTLAIPFEILGILLTAVMFGALVIARPITVTGNEETSLVHPNVGTLSTENTERREIPGTVVSANSVSSVDPASEGSA